jgi:putative Mn2+ efflux pump MntP
MDVLRILLIAISMSLDSLALAVACGLKMQRVDYPFALKAAIIFGVIEGGMPVLGWWIGGAFSALLTAIDHWVAFLVLSGIGINTLRESREAEEAESRIKGLGFWMLVWFGVVTAIDSLAVGVTFGVLEIPILVPALMIGGCTAVVTFVGVVLGELTGKTIGSKTSLVAGVALIVIGVSFLVDGIA